MPRNGDPYIQEQVALWLVAWRENFEKLVAERGGISSPVLAELAGLNPGHVADFRAGRYGNATVYTLVALAAALGRDLSTELVPDPTDR